MAVTIRHFCRTLIFRKRFYKLEHHRNPSGFNNKIKWICSKSEWNIDKLHELYKHIVITDENESNWEHAFTLAKKLITEKEMAMKIPNTMNTFQTSSRPLIL